MNEFMQTALLAEDPVEWLAYKMTEPLEPVPETIGEAHAIIKPLINRAFDSMLQNRCTVCADKRKEVE